MPVGPPLPLKSHTLLRQLLPHSTAGVLGVWLRRSKYPLRIRVSSGGIVLISPDLGYLLGRCSRIAVRQDGELVILDPDCLIRWRSLQVIATNPYLPAVARLKDQLGDVHTSSSGLLVPISFHNSPEEVLALLNGAGLTVAGSRVVYSKL